MAQTQPSNAAAPTAIAIVTSFEILPLVTCLSPRLSLVSALGGMNGKGGGRDGDEGLGGQTYIGSSTASTSTPSALDAALHAPTSSQTSARNAAMATDASATRIPAVTLTLAAATTSVTLSVSASSTAANFDL